MVLDARDENDMVCEMCLVCTTQPVSTTNIGNI